VFDIVTCTAKLEEYPAQWNINMPQATKCGTLVLERACMEDEIKKKSVKSIL